MRSQNPDLGTPGLPPLRIFPLGGTLEALQI